MVFDWSLSDSKSPQLSRTFLSNLAVLNNSVVWMVSTRPPIKSSSPFNDPLVTVTKAPITIGIIVTFMFHSFFQFPSKVEVLILLFPFFQLLLLLLLLLSSPLLLLLVVIVLVALCECLCVYVFMRRSSRKSLWYFFCFKLTSPVFFWWSNSTLLDV